MEVLILEKRYHEEHEKFLEKMLFFEKFISNEKMSVQ
jgi:hypothetical protein